MTDIDYADDDNSLMQDEDATPVSAGLDCG